jgi:hypothetical protein
MQNLASVRIFLRKQKSHVLSGDRTPDHPGHSQITTPSTLSHLHIYSVSFWNLIQLRSPATRCLCAHGHFIQIRRPFGSAGLLQNFKHRQYSFRNMFIWIYWTIILIKPALLLGLQNFKSSGLEKLHVIKAFRTSWCRLVLTTSNNISTVSQT